MLIPLELFTNRIRTVASIPIDSAHLLMGHYVRLLLMQWELVASD
jgi:hypothetical protein